MSEYRVRMAEEPICDFCSQPYPTRTFHMDSDFTMDKSPGFPEFRSKGDWMACAECGSMIDRGDWVDLQVRAYRSLKEKYKNMLPRSILVETIKRSHGLFRQHWKKP